VNALVSLDSILEPETIGAENVLSPATIFAPGGVEAIISKIETEVRAEVFDITTAVGRERVKSVAYKIARSKTTLDDMGKDLVADIKAKSAAIDKERKTVRDRLDALKEEVRSPLTAWEEAEKKRVDGCESALVAIIEAGRQASGKPSGLIRELIVIVEGYSAREWQEFKERADAAITESLRAINGALADAEQRERDAAELEALRKEKAQRDAQEQERLAEQERQRQAQERAEREAREAEARAELERQRQEQAERDKAAAVERARQEERERAERAQAEAVAAERRRQEQEAAAAAARKAAEEAAEQKRQANKRHREKVRREIGSSLIAAVFADETMTAEQDEFISAVIDAIDGGKIPHLSINY
jgi:colicin import membrane protein